MVTVASLVLRLVRLEPLETKIYDLNEWCVLDNRHFKECCALPACHRRGKGTLGLCGGPRVQTHALAQDSKHTQCRRLQQPAKAGNAVDEARGKHGC